MGQFNLQDTVFISRDEYLSLKSIKRYAAFTALDKEQVRGGYLDFADADDELDRLRQRVIVRCEVNGLGWWQIADRTTDRVIEASS